MTDSKKNIADLIAQLVALKKSSEEDLLDCPNEVLPGRQALKNSALQSYNEMFGILRGAIGGYSGCIFVSGPGSQRFADLAEDGAPAIVLDASQLYAEIAAVWHPTIRVDKVFALDCLPAFMLGLSAQLGPLGVRSITPPDFTNRFGTKVESFADAVNVTRDIVRATLGDDLNVLFLTHKLSEKVIAEEWELRFVTVVVLNATTAETHPGTLFNDLCNAHGACHNVMVENAAENVDENAVLIACKHLRAKFLGTSPAAPKCGYSPAEGAPGCPETLVDGKCSTHPDLTYTDQSETTDKPKRKYTRKPTTTQ